MSLSCPSSPAGFMTGKMAVLFSSPSTLIFSYNYADLLTTHAAHLSTWFQIHQCTQKESYLSPGSRSECTLKHTQNSATKA